MVDGSGGSTEADSMRLAVKVGIGVGSCTMLHLGGVLGRVEYVALGEGLTQVQVRQSAVATSDVVFVVPNSIFNRAHSS